MAGSSDAVVLLLKSKNQDDEYEKLLRTRGYEPVFIPVLSFEFTNETILHEKLKKPDEFCGLIFTSQRAVDAIYNCTTDSKLTENWRTSLQKEWTSKPVFVTGKATAKSVAEKLEFANIFGGNSGSAQALAQLILETIPSNSEKTLLFPCANIKKEILPHVLEEAGRSLCSVIAYCTKADPDILHRLQTKFPRSGERQPRCIVFFSPSGVTFSGEMLKNALPLFGGIKLIAIGQSTSKGLIDHGFKVSGTAQKPDPISLVNTLDTSLKEQK